jgi:hypothetical protein
MTTEAWENITPKLAEKYLNLNTNNRPLRPGHAEKMVHDIKAGAWTECLAPIIFYDDGSLADGQHRLWAISESGETIRFKVYRNYPRPAGINIDTGVTRTPVDQARIHGIDPELSNAIAAVCRGVEDGDVARSDKQRSTSEMLVIIAKHREAAHWASKNGPKGKGMRNAAVLSAVARAYYVEKEKERLLHFGTIMTKGFIETNEDSAAVAMRNYIIMRLQQKKPLANATNWRDTFIKTQNAIYQFMRHKPLSMIKVVGDESYPLAERIDTMKPPKTQIGVRRASKVATATKRKAKGK